MKHSLWAVALIVLISSGCNEDRPVPVFSPSQLIPQPQFISESEGSFLLPSGCSLYTASHLLAEADFLKGWLADGFGINTTSSSDSAAADICLSTADLGLGDEGYQLTIDVNGIAIVGQTAHGLFHGIQTLRQIEPQTFITKGKTVVHYPMLTIKDEPRFPHRGMLLDCCRHFMDKEFVKRYIDLLAYHKMNTLHWHLTEDQGWRIEIKKYPKLTEVGAWRTEEDGSRYGGFYSQDDIREVVAHANSRHVTIIPEIELPGHSCAAIAAYPQLSCEGKSIPVEAEWGVFKDIYCAGNDSVFIFLKDVLTEVMTLFPSEYIHIGGDEAPKFRWEHCDKCQKRITAMGLHDEHELQSWFIGEIGTFLEENGRKMIGWDEILEGGLPAGAAVQSWRGVEGGIAAARAGHEVVMSPTSHCYFDYGLESTDMFEVYEFDPIPSELAEDKHHFIRGGECNMWTEHAPQNTIDSKVFPRILAMAEVLWTYPAIRDKEEFHSRVKTHFARLDALGVDYGFECVPLAFTTTIGDSATTISIAPNIDDLSIRFRSVGDKSWEEFTQAISTSSTANLEFQVERGGKLYPTSIQSHICYHQALNKPFELNFEYSPWYSGGGDSALVDGILGTLDFRDGHWQALQGGNVDLIVDLGVETQLSNLSSRYYFYGNAWIFLPSKVEYFSSHDGEHWTSLGSVSHAIDPKNKDQLIQEFPLETTASARYVRLVGHNFGQNPEWHDAPGLASWIFCDEFVVR
jgi:hexosaminidase